MHNAHKSRKFGGYYCPTPYFVGTWPSSPRVVEVHAALDNSSISEVLVSTQAFFIFDRLVSIPAPDANVHCVDPLSICGPSAERTRRDLSRLRFIALRYDTHQSDDSPCLHARFHQWFHRAASRGGGCRGGECLQRRPRPYFFQEGTRSHTVFKKISFTHISGIIDIK